MKEGKRIMGDVTDAANQGIELLTRCREELLTAAREAQRQSDIASARFQAVDATYQALHRAKQAIADGLNERKDRDSMLEWLEKEASCPTRP